MRIKCEWRDYLYYFDFFVEDVSIVDEMTKTAHISTVVLTNEKQEIWRGMIDVNWNHTGIYPNPKQVKEADLPQTVKRMLLVEIRRYLKPQKAFL
ncbi:MAG: hypothetical protein ACI4XL_10975 [Bacillus sp. (in: firmicutes)]